MGERAHAQGEEARLPGRSCYDPLAARNVPAPWEPSATVTHHRSNEEARVTAPERTQKSRTRFLSNILDSRLQMIAYPFEDTWTMATASALTLWTILSMAYLLR
jgi:hypothetical protein